MISLQKLFKRDSFNNQGNRLSKIVREKLLNTNEECSLDFAGIPFISPQFFQDFIFPLVIEFGSHDLDNKLRFINLKDDHLVSYRKACDQTSAYIDRLSSRDINLFGDMSDITLELLIKARELSRTDPSATRVIFGINSGMAKSFANMDIEMIRRIANAGIICFEPRFTPEFAAKMVALNATEIDVFLNIIGGLEDVYEAQYL
jgi:hypothetical protein